MKNYGRLWKIMEDYGRLWKIMEDYGRLEGIVEILWSNGGRMMEEKVKKG